MKYAISHTRRAAIAVIGMTLAAPLYSHQGQSKQSAAQQFSGTMHNMAGQMKIMQS